MTTKELEAEIIEIKKQLDTINNIVMMNHGQVVTVQGYDKRFLVTIGFDHKNNKAILG